MLEALEVKFKVRTKDSYLYVKAKMSFGEKMDEKELDRFARLGLRGFLKPQIIKKGLVEYVGPIGQNLYERLREPINKRDFLFIIEHLIVALQKLQANGLSINNMLMDIHNVFINKVTKEVQFMYIPVTTSNNEKNILEFVETIIYSVKPFEATDADCISRFKYLVNGLNGFQTEEIERFIEKEDKSIVNTIKKNNAGQSGYMTDKPKHYYEHYDNQSNSAEENTALLYEEEATGLLVEEEATGLLVEEEVTGLLVEEEATGLLNDSYKEETTPVQVLNVHYASLHRMLTDETISINKPVFRIGKENSYVDYFVSNNINISRSHVDIVTRASKYYVIDLNSKNHTYINGQMLQPHCETEIHDGDILKLANEDFVFYA